ncbi:MAG: homocysteine S-methyltransferase family protein, partial [Acidaminococcales bacterium]|nr:homocysteine S-methyltransferase family protein [Acidaminococcales bacterium]
MLKMFDGAMGTQLQAFGLADKPCPEYAAVTNPDRVTAIHREYIAAGADIIETNTFGANRLKLKDFGLETQVGKIVTAAVRAARGACGRDTLVAGSAGPTGRLIAPLGDCSFDEAAAAYEEQIKALAGAGADYILIETIIDLQEMRAAVLAAKAACRLPIIGQLTLGENGRTVTGSGAAAAAALLEPLGVSVVGLNCSLGPEQLLPLVAELAKETNLPVSVQPNAGLPVIENGRTVFPLSPEDMAAWVPRLVAAGASFVG